MAEVLVNRVLVELIISFQDGMPGALTSLDYTWKHCIFFIRNVREFNFIFNGLLTSGSDLFLHTIDRRFPIHFALFKGDHTLALQYAKSFREELFNMDRVSSLLCCASKYSALNVVKWLCLNKFVINKYVMDAAAGNGHLDIVQYLHENTSAGCTFRAINSAAANGHLNVVEFLHTFRSEGGTDSGLVAAAGNGHLLVVKYLYSVMGLNLSPEAFLAAATENHLDIMDYLLGVEEFHPQVIAMAATRAIKNKRADIVKYIIESKGVRQEYWKALATPRDIETFHYLVEHGIAFSLTEMNQLPQEADLTLLQAIYAYAIDHNYSDPFTNASIEKAIYHISNDEQICLEIIQFLCEKGVKSPPQEILVTTASRGYLKIAQFLHEIYGLQFSTDCIYEAACHGHFEFVRYLYGIIGESIPANCMDIAAEKGFIDIVEFIHGHQNQGCTTKAMDSAAANGHFEVVKFLATNRTEGCTTNAIDRAALLGYLNIVEYLTVLRKPATWKAINGAALNGHFEVVQYLLERRDEGFTQDAVPDTLSVKIRKLLLSSKVMNLCLVLTKESCM
ncbi:hypothetical protein THRCLA_22090 [Thraustotheca clavata]|uniref:Uncharacterized protein n=1 Tax=Thraustotheca clavata TaxID=74557 RepID=A0A1V9ZCK6_9STRA|nr:hypothetical protein THRCLA_22090 [Thraustotheca clavata]